MFDSNIVGFQCCTKKRCSIPNNVLLYDSSFSSFSQHCINPWIRTTDLFNIVQINSVWCNVVYATWFGWLEQQRQHCTRYYWNMSDSHQVFWCESHMAVYFHFQCKSVNVNHTHPFNVIFFNVNTGKELLATDLLLIPCI